MIGVLAWLIHDGLKDKLSRLVHVGVDARGRDCAFVALAQANTEELVDKSSFYENLTIQ